MSATTTPLQILEDTKIDFDQGLGLLVRAQGSGTMKRRYVGGALDLFRTHLRKTEAAIRELEDGHYDF